MNEIVTKVKIAANGRMVLPQAVRTAMGIDGETKLIAKVEDGELKLLTVSQGIARAQELYRKNVERERTTDEFLATRERE